MGCFFGCFVSSKDKKCRKQRYRAIRRDQKPRIQDILRADESLELSIKETPSNPIRESREKTEAPPLSLKRRKKVTFDTNVITYEHVQVYDSTESLLERNEKGETFPKSKDEDSVALSTSNYRYGNCVESDDEFEDFDQEDYDFDEEDYYSDCDLDDDEEVLVPSMESNRNARDNNGYVLSVFNPIENLDQWKALKSKGSTRKPSNAIGQKENAAEPGNQNQETVVDTSLSSWMISSSEKCQRNNKRVAC
uniref:uncharacterized protein LOC122582760 n=1 Tax=Erigeron canadensis TaxID=72917 RepID=UPI001CB89C9B|nr:uncharacterized protein LOC122582760 [Erigeron canadensis]